MNFTYYESLSVLLAVDLINTLCPVTGTDSLSMPDELKQFLIGARNISGIWSR